MTNKPSRFSRSFSNWAVGAFAALFSSLALASPGAIWTTLGNGQTVNANLYESKPLVHLNGGPQGNGGGIPDGNYYFQVTDPSGAVLLSDDPIHCRGVQVVNGKIAGAIPGPTGCKHNDGQYNPANGTTPVQLVPFKDTPNNGGEYKLWLTKQTEYNFGACPDNFGFCGGDVKTDNFKVKKQLPAHIEACKYNDSNNNGTFDQGDELIPGWPITATGVDGGTVTLVTGVNGCVSFTVTNPGSGSLVTVAEGSLGDLWVQTAPADGTYPRAGDSPAYTVAGGVASTNDLQSQDMWTVDFGNFNTNCPGGTCNPPTCLTNPTPECVGLEVTKTAHPWYRMTWTMEKTANSATIYADAEGNATAGYTVTVNHGAGTDFSVSGEIMVSNATVMDADGVNVTDVMGGGWQCFVLNGTNISVPAGQTVTLQYRCRNGSLAAPPAEVLSNTATATWATGAASSPAVEVNFANATVVDGTVTVSDPMAANSPFTVSHTTASPIVLEYSKVLTGSLGTCVDYPNTATLHSLTPNTRMQDLTSSATVKVCQANNPVVTKTAETTFKRTYNWKIEKSATPAQQNVSGGTAKFDYTVTLTQLAPTDSDWKVTGTITVTNSNAFGGPMSVNVADSVPTASNGPLACTVATPVLSVPERSGTTNGSASTTYSCTYTSAPPASPFNNTATATWTQATYHTPSGSASGTAAVNFGTPTETVNKVITVKDAFNGADPALIGTLLDPAGDSTVTANDTTPVVKVFTYSRNLGTTAGTCSTYPNIASFKSNDSDAAGSANASVKVCQGADLSVTKTATPTFKRSYTWNITKTVDNASLKTNGPDVTFNYTVSASQTGFQDSDWQVTGTITVTNPNDWQDVSVNLSDAIGSTGVCTVNGSASATINVPKKVGAVNGSATASYTCTYASQPASEFNNVVTASWTGASTPNTSATGNATGNFNTPTSTLHKTINVTDAFNGGSGALLFSLTATDPPAAPASGSQTYPRSVNTAPGTCTTYPNIARFASTETTPATGSANQSVEVCRGANLTVSKTVNTTYARTYNWTLAKAVDKTSVNVAAPNQATFNYTVTATQTGFSDTNIGASGTITITNPNTWQDISVNVADAIVGGPSCTITEGATANVLRNTTVTLHYTCAPSSVTSFTNQVTASWNGAAAYTPDSSASNTAAGSFGAPSSTTNAVVTVTDIWNGETPPAVLGTVNAVDTGLPKATDFTYSKTVSGVAGACTRYTNVATLAGDTASGRDSKTVEVCVGVDITVSKTANPSFQREYLWTIDKTVDNTLFIAGGTANYSVTVTQTGVTNTGWMVQGTITVTNPNTWQSVFINLADAINNGGSCSIADGSSNIEIVAGGTVTKTYNCLYGGVAPSNMAFTNTATATVIGGVVPNSSVSGSMAGEFTNPSNVLNQTVTVNDTMGGVLGSVTGNATAPYKTHTFTYGRFIEPPASGCTVVDNIATIVETGASDSVQVSACDIAGHTMGFWHNKNGQKIINGANQLALADWLDQFNAFANVPSDGQPGAIGEWVLDVIDDASCAGTSCSRMLRAQMLSTALAVYFSDPALGGNKINQPVPIGGALISLLNPTNVSAAFGGATSMTIMNMLLFQNTVSTANGATWYGGNKTLQTSAKTAFDNINNGKIAGP